MSQNYNAERFGVERRKKQEEKKCPHSSVVPFVSRHLGFEHKPRKYITPFRLPGVEHLLGTTCKTKLEMTLCDQTHTRWVALTFCWLPCAQIFRSLPVRCQQTDPGSCCRCRWRQESEGQHQPPHFCPVGQQPHSSCHPGSGCRL